MPRSGLANSTFGKINGGGGLFCLSGFTLSLE
jgi:hypothetical protein